MAMKKYPPSQEDVLGALIKVLNEQRAANYLVVGRPDQAERNRAEVDYVLRDDTQLPEIAVEVSTTWRSEEAGKEDADWTAWTEVVRNHARGRIPAEFLLSTPMRIPLKLSADKFAEGLVEVLEREHASLARLHQSGQGAYLTACDTSVFLTYAREGAISPSAGSSRRATAVSGQNISGAWW
jgi:hypothetical protein